MAPLRVIIKASAGDPLFCLSQVTRGGRKLLFAPLRNDVVRVATFKTEREAAEVCAMANLSENRCINVDGVPYGLENGDSLSPGRMSVDDLKGLGWARFGVDDYVAIPDAAGNVCVTVRASSIFSCDPGSGDLAAYLARMLR